MIVKDFMLHESDSHNSWLLSVCISLTSFVLFTFDVSMFQAFNQLFGVGCIHSEVSWLYYLGGRVRKLADVKSSIRQFSHVVNVRRIHLQCNQFSFAV
jgi:hypothetical protein